MVDTMTRPPQTEAVEAPPLSQQPSLDTATPQAPKPETQVAGPSPLAEAPTMQAPEPITVSADGATPEAAYQQVEQIQDTARSLEQIGEDLLVLRSSDEDYKPAQAAHLVQEYVDAGGNISDLLDNNTDFGRSQEIQEGVRLELNRQNDFNTLIESFRQEGVNNEVAFLNYVADYGLNTEKVQQELMQHLSQEQQTQLQEMIDELRTKDEAEIQQRIKELTAMLNPEATGEALEGLTQAEEISAESVVETEQIDDETLQMTIDQDGEIKEFTVKDFIWIAAFVAADVVLFRGRYTTAMVEDIASKTLGRAAREKTADILGKLGIDVPEDFLESGNRNVMYEAMLDKINTQQLVGFLESLTQSHAGKKEIYNFLDGLHPDEMKKMMAGEQFGKGLFGAKHKLEQKHLDMLYETLSERQIEMLGLTDIKAQVLQTQ